MTIFAHKNAPDQTVAVSFGQAVDRKSSSKMKTVAILFCVVVVVSYGSAKSFKEEMMEKVTEIAEQCQKESGAGDDDIAALVEKKVPSSHEGKCMLACIHIKMGVQNEDGSINKEGSMAAVAPLKEHNEEMYNKVTSIMEACHEKTTVDADKCITAGNMMQCGVDEAKKMGLDAAAF